MSMYRMFYVSLLCLLSYINLNGQTVHFVSMFDTKDAKLGSGMAYECAMINNEFQTIAGYLEDFGFDSEISEYTGDNCGKTQLLTAINGLEIAPEDVVLFYYGGHGGRPVNSTDSFPQMCLGHQNQENFVPATLIRNIIESKNPQLTIVITGCCNSESRGISIKSVVAQSQGYTSEGSIDKSRYKNLFTDFKGVIQFTSSRPGEYSFAGNTGSWFAANLLNVIDDIGRGKVGADWESLCEEVGRRVSDEEIIFEGQKYRMHPYAEIKTTSISGDGNNDKKSHDGSVRKRVNDDDYNLIAEINALLDKSKSREQRLCLIPSILEKHFNYGAKVITLGRDMATVVDYEDADVFLKRITMSPYISQINIVKQEQGKNSLITVHEVRTR